jgi:hypothetical protein
MIDFSFEKRKNFPFNPIHNSNSDLLPTFPKTSAKQDKKYTYMDYRNISFKLAYDQ